MLRQAFATPDVGAGLRSTAYWNLLPIGGANLGFITDPDVAANIQRALRAENKALAIEIENQIKALEQARNELAALKSLAARPGLRVVYDTNMLNHWRQPGDVLWQEVFKAQGERVQLRQDAVLEVWVDTDDRGGDADLSILRCAADLANLHPDHDARVLTDEIGMRLRAQQMGLRVMRLPEDHRKKGTALDDVPPQQDEPPAANSTSPPR